MKAYELMLGDWIRYQDNYPTEPLRGRYAVITALDGRITTSKNNSWQSEHPAWLEAIPLTKEMLDINGFKEEALDEDYAKVIYKNFVLYKKSSGLYFIPCGHCEREIRYVHTLQHILRFMGFAYLADNFKIE